MQHMETLYALSSGALPSGVAVVRVSGPASRFAVETIAGTVPPPRHAQLRVLRDPQTGEMLDKGLVLWFPAPHSFTGEDCAEFQVHGGPAVVSAVLSALGSLEGVRMAEAGEFSRRSFENGRLDLTELEGLSDLIAAQTQAQRRQAVAQSTGRLRKQLESWRSEIIRMRAMIEAELDFADEDDVPESAAASVWADGDSLAKRIGDLLADNNRGELIRSGFEIVLLGPPNSGKSSLLNALAQREAAIVSEEAGTTRDLIEVQLDIGGYAVRLVDTAGIREAEGAVEREGIRRARERASHADLVIWLIPPEAGHLRPSPPAEVDPDVELLAFHSKDDSGAFQSSGISVVRENGLSDLIHAVRERVSKRLGNGDDSIVTRRRHRECLENCVAALRAAVASETLGIELRAEHLRSAGDELGRLTGVVDVEDLLDVIFSEFCVGK